MVEIERVLWIALGGLIAAIMGYFGGYFKEKGKNYATKEDFDALRIQQQELTRATKEVEATISKELWDQKRQWEIKRDALFEGCRVMAEFNAALVRLHTVWTFEIAEAEKGVAEPLMLKHRNESATALNDASNSFERAQLLISIVSGSEVQKALGTMGKLLKNLAADVVNGKQEGYATLAPLLKGAEKLAVDAMRKELSISEPAGGYGSLSTGTPKETTGGMA
jgi:hypothetical protein